MLQSSTSNPNPKGNNPVPLKLVGLDICATPLHMVQENIFANGKLGASIFMYFPSPFNPYSPDSAPTHLLWRFGSLTRMLWKTTLGVGDYTGDYFGEINKYHPFLLFPLPISIGGSILSRGLFRQCFKKEKDLDLSTLCVGSTDWNPAVSHWLNQGRLIESELADELSH